MESWSGEYTQKVNANALRLEKHWDGIFSNCHFDPSFVESLLDVHPEIMKEEGSMIEQQFVLWFDRQLKRRRLEYHLKLSDVPYESTSGFRLNPEYYRDEKELEDLR